MKYVLVGTAALMLTACNGFNLPVIPPAPTAQEVSDAQVEADKNIQMACEAIDQNYTNVQGWLDFADALGGAFDIEVGNWVKIPADLVDTKDKVCD